MSDWLDMVNNMTSEDLEKNAGSFEPIPDGWYSAIVSDAQEVRNKSGNGHHVSICFTLTQDNDSYAGRKVWENYNTDNPNETARNIGIAKLKRLLIAANISSVSDVSDIQDAVVQIKVGRDKRDNERNTVSSYRPDGVTPDKQESSQAEHNTASAPPWKR